MVNLPAREPSLSVDIHMTSNPSKQLVPGTQLVAYLIDPAGNSVSYSTNYTTSSSSSTTPAVVDDVSLYHTNARAGVWRIVLDWPNPVSGAALSVPFTGTITFSAFAQTNNLPASAATHISAKSGQTFAIKFCNPSKAQQAFFANPRLSRSGTASYPLANLLGSGAGAGGATFVPGAELIYGVPPDSTQLQSSLFSTTPITYDLFYFTGDPDMSPAVKAPGVSGSQSGDEAALTYSTSEVGQGLWGLVTDEIGPYPAAGAKSTNAQANLSATTQPFDGTVTSSTGDLWPDFTLSQPTQSFTPEYLAAGSCGHIMGTITPTGVTPGTVVHGILYIDDYVLGSNITSGFIPSNFGLGILRVATRSSVSRTRTPSVHDADQVVRRNAPHLHGSAFVSSTRRAIDRGRTPRARPRRSVRRSSIRRSTSGRLSRVLNADTSLSS